MKYLQVEITKIPPQFLMDILSSFLFQEKYELKVRRIDIHTTFVPLDFCFFSNIL